MKKKPWFLRRASRGMWDGLDKGNGSENDVIIISKRKSHD